jgi:protein TonB
MSEPAPSHGRWSRWPDYVRWIACFTIALMVHAAGAVAVLTQWNKEELTANPPTITIDLAPIAAAPTDIQTDVPVGPQQVETPPEEEPPPPPPPEAELQLDEPPPPPEPPKEVKIEEPPKPPEKPKEKKKVVRQTSAPAPAKKHERVAAAPAPGAGSDNPLAVPNWKSRLVAALERSKRYPSGANGDHGVAHLAFSVDRNGGVHNARIVRSSGSSILDHATLELIARAQPLPAPPPEMHGAQIAIVVPIRYNVR